MASRRGKEKCKGTFWAVGLIPHLHVDEGHVSVPAAETPWSSRAADPHLQVAPQGVLLSARAQHQSVVRLSRVSDRRQPGDFSVVIKAASRQRVQFSVPSGSCSARGRAVGVALARGAGVQGARRRRSGRAAYGGSDEKLQSLVSYVFLKNESVVCVRD